jgi:hypothetical protein
MCSSTNSETVLSCDDEYRRATLQEEMNMVRFVYLCEYREC